jgi:hypothetical protein
VLVAIASFLARNPRSVALAGLFLLTVAAYGKGRADCGAKHARAAAKIEAEWKARAAEAAQDAYERGVAAAYADAKNEEIANEIEDAAAAEPGADDLCLSADVVERLRAIK